MLKLSTNTNVPKSNKSNLFNLRFVLCAIVQIKPDFRTSFLNVWTKAKPRHYIYFALS